METYVEVNFTVETAGWPGIMGDNANVTHIQNLKGKHFRLNSVTMHRLCDSEKTTFL